MSGLTRFAFAVLCLAFAVFCVFGFLSGPEAADASTSVRIVYAFMGIAFVGASIWLMRPIRRTAE